VLKLQTFHDKIEYVLPAEGAMRWVDFLAVMASSPHHTEAMRFINYIQEPAVMARLAQYLRYAPANSAAEALLPAEFKANRVIYPEADKVERCERSVLLSPKARKLQTEIFRRIVPQK
jgi:putrescine transport system substrate-binding protein